jgi:VanZ family protein|uniref:VanZ family protein n=1 Tax=candidate division WOR-3 bacterium TaxID=2052148 RepID=A0A7C3YTS1_UNCW3
MRKEEVLITFLILFLILFLSFLPLPSSPKTKRYPIDKVAHLIFYTLWGYFSYPLLGFFAIVFGGLLGLITEWVQRFIPNRDASFLDLLFNFFGVFLGVFLQRRRKR